MADYVASIAKQNNLTKEQLLDMMHPERVQSRLATGPYEGAESYLPPQLRMDQIGQYLTGGINQLGSLIQRPGGLSPNVSESILPRLAAESQNIGQNFRGLQANQAGMAARSNLPVSIKAALQSALGVSEERAQRGARGAALLESEELRRGDIDRVLQLLDTILQFQQSGRGGDIASRGLDLQSKQNADQRKAAYLAFFGSLLGGPIGGAIGNKVGGG